jgi:2-methylisocitrate lyase-like PEP mutase family enzyme
VSSASVLRSLLAGTAEKPLVFPGVGTPLEALSAEAAGFAAVYLSGYAVAAWRHGLPDIGLLGARDTAEALTAITRVTSVPVIVDADTGYGDAASVHSTVRLLEAAGAAAIQFEDQAWPKKCGHMSDKEVIDADDAARKIEAAVAARTNPDTVIIARTDAIGPLGLDEAIRRARLYRNAGADALFVDAPQSLEQLVAIGSQLEGMLIVNMSEGGMTPPMSATQLHALGFGVVLFPTTALRVCAKVTRQLFDDLRVQEDTRSWRERMYGLDELNELVHLDDYDRIGRNTLPLEAV